MEIIEDEHYYLFTNAKMKINSSDYESALNDLNKINDSKVTMCIDHMKMICMFMLEKFETIIEFYYINKTKVIEYIKLNEDLLKIISCAFYECGMRKKAKELYPSIIPDFISEKSEFFLPSNKKKEDLSSENVEQFSISISPPLQDKELKNEEQNNTNTNNGQGYKECKNYFDNEKQNNQNNISRTKTCQEQGNKHFKSEKIEEEKKSPSERGNKRKIPKIERKPSDKSYLSKHSGNNANIINDDKESKKSEQIPVMNNEDKQSKKSEQFPIVYNEEAKSNHKEEQKEQSVKSSVSSLNKESVIKEIELKSEAGDKTNEKKEADTQEKFEVKEQNMSSINNVNDNIEDNAQKVEDKKEEIIEKSKEEQKETNEEEKVKEIVRGDNDKEKQEEINKDDKTEKEGEQKNQTNESNKDSERKQDLNQTENKEIINKEVNMNEVDNTLDKKSTIEKKQENQEEKLPEVNDIIQETIDNNKENKNENEVHEQQDKSNQITTEQKEVSIDNEKKESEDLTTPDKIEEKKKEPVNEETKNEKVNENENKQNTEEEVTIPKKESDYKDDQPPISKDQPPEKEKEKKEVKEEQTDKMNDLSQEAKNEQSERKNEQNKAVTSREEPLSKEGERLPTLTDRISFKSSENQQQENNTDNNNNTNKKEQSFSIGEISKEFVSENPPSSKTSEKKEEKIKPINLPKPGHNSIQKHPIEHSKVHATNLSPRGGTPLVDYHFNHPDYNPNKDVQQEIEKIKEIPKIEEESKKESDSEQEKKNQNDNNKIKLEPITYNLENIVRLNPKRAQTKKDKEIVIPDKAVPPAKAETERILSKKEKEGNINKK